MEPRAPTGRATGKVLFGVFVAPGNPASGPQVKHLLPGEKDLDFRPVYQVSYIHIATPFFHIYFATEKWKELGRKAIKVSRKSL